MPNHARRLMPRNRTDTRTASSMRVAAYLSAILLMGLIAGLVPTASSGVIPDSMPAAAVQIHTTASGINLRSDAIGNALINVYAQTTGALESRYSRDNGSTWISNAPIDLDAGATPNYGLNDFVAESETSWTVAGSDISSGNWANSQATYLLRRSTDAGGNWTTTAVISSQALDSRSIQLERETSGTLWAFAINCDLGTVCSTTYGALNNEGLGVYRVTQNASVVTKVDQIGGCGARGFRGAVTPAGDRHLVLCQPEGVNQPIYARRSTGSGQSWGFVAQVPSSTNAYPHDLRYVPSLDAWLLLYHSPTVHLFATLYSEATSTWSTPVQLSATPINGFTSLHVNQDAIWTAYRDNLSRIIVAASSNGVLWAQTAPFAGHGAINDLVVTGVQRPHLFFRDNSPSLLYWLHPTTNSTFLQARDQGTTFPRQLVDLEADWGYNATVYVREVGSGQPGTVDGRIFRLSTDLVQIGNRDPCTGTDYAAPASLRGLRYTWDQKVITVCQDNAANPNQAILRVMPATLEAGTSYGYPQDNVFGPFLIRSVNSDFVAYSTFENLQNAGQVRFDHANLGQSVSHTVMPGIRDVAVDEGGFNRYAAMNDTHVLVFDATGNVTHNLDRNTYPGIGGGGCGAGSLLLRNNQLIVGNCTGVYRWSLGEAGSASRVLGAENQGITIGAGALKWSKDHQRIIAWEDAANGRTFLLNGGGLATEYATPIGLFGSLQIRSADMDFANNYLYVVVTDANAVNDVYRFAVYGVTTSLGGDGPIGQPNPPPEPATDPRDDAPGPDDDNDALPDGWEARYFGNETNQTGSTDSDGDGYTNAEEYEAQTDPTNATNAPTTHGGGGGDTDIAGNDGSVRGFWIVGAIVLVALAVVLPTTRRNKT